MKVSSQGRLPLLSKKVSIEIFRRYLVVSFLLISIHGLFEYKLSKEQIDEEAYSLTRSFMPAISSALWNFQNDQISAIAEGMAESELILGVRVFSKEQNLMIEVLDDKLAEGDTLVGSRLNIQRFVDNKSFKILGELEYIVNEELALSRFTASLISLLLSDIIKLLSLWFIIKICTQQLVTLPARKLTLKLLSVSKHGNGGYARERESYSYEFDRFRKVYNFLNRQWNRRLTELNNQLTELKRQTRNYHKAADNSSQKLHEEHKLRKEADRRIREERELSAALVDGSPSPVIILNSNREIERCNSLMVALLKQNGSLSGVLIDDLLTDAQLESLKPQLNDLFNKERYAFSLDFILNDGEVITYHFITQLVNVASDKHLLAQGISLPR